MLKCRRAVNASEHYMGFVHLYRRGTVCFQSSCVVQLQQREGGFRLDGGGTKVAKSQSRTAGGAVRHQVLERPSTKRIQVCGCELISISISLLIQSRKGADASGRFLFSVFCHSKRPAQRQVPLGRKDPPPYELFLVLIFVGFLRINHPCDRHQLKLDSSAFFLSATFSSGSLLFA